MMLDEGVPTLPPIPSDDSGPTPLQESLTQVGSVMGAPLVLIKLARSSLKSVFASTLVAVRSSRGMC